MGQLKWWCIGIVLSCVSSVAVAQFVPYGVDIAHPNAVLIFADDTCDACEHLTADWPMLFVGAEEDLPYTPYVYDDNLLLHRTFRIHHRPTVVVLGNGQEITRLASVDMAEIQAALAAADSGELTHPYNYAIAIGENVDGKFHDYTGLLVFYRESCPECELLQPVLTDLCQTAGITITILSTRDEPIPEACPGDYARDIALDWGIPGVPSMVYLQSGRVMWIDLGYREESDLRALVALLVEQFQ